MPFHNETNETPHAAVTAGTTQTQAGATALTGRNNAVTTGNASDGVYLPRIDTNNAIGKEITVTNLSAVTLKVFPYYNVAAAAGSGGTIDGGAANAAISHTASTTRKYICTAADTWKSILL